MRYRHSLDLVRMRFEDGTLHCETHGLLPEDEAVDVWSRSKITAEIAQEFRPTGWRVKVLETLARLRRPKCVPLS